MLDDLKREVYEANLQLVEKKLVIYTWGNVSGIDRERNLVVIKPSGVAYETMRAEDMVVVDLMSGEVVEGVLKPSSDTPTHLALYRKYSEIGGVTHTHSTYAVAFAQAGRSIRTLGTTHADYFYGDIPCTRALTREEVDVSYEANTGNVIVETMEARGLAALEMPGILVRYHGPFNWGKDPAQSVYHAAVMEKIAEMTIHTEALSKDCALPGYILEKHYQRKHGPNAYYGQDKRE